MTSARTKDEGLPAEVVQRATQGRMHHHYINLERTEIANARDLIRDLAKEVVRLRTMLTDKRKSNP